MALDTAGGIEQALQSVVDRIVPAIADWCRIEATVSPEGTLLVTATARSQGEVTQQLDEARPALTLPLRTHDGTIGTLQATNASDRGELDAPTAAALTEVGRRCATAVEVWRLQQQVDEAAQQQQRSLNLLDAMLTETPLGLAFFDLDLRFQRVNETLAAISGLSIEAHVGRRLSDVLPQFGDAVDPMLERVLEGSEPNVEVEVSGMVPGRNDGSSHWIAHLHPVRSGAGTIVGVGAILVDVTERKRADDARIRSESQLRLALESARMGLWHWNAEGPDNIRWSQTMALLLGVDPLAPATTEALFGAIHEEDHERVRDTMRNARANRVPYEIEFRVVWPDGTVHWLLCKGQIRNDAGSEGEMVGVALDITERRAVQNESARLALRRARAGEQAVRMQRVTAALSEALTVSQVCDVILTEGCAVVNAPRGSVSLLAEDSTTVETTRILGYEEESLHFWDHPKPGSDIPLEEAMRTGNPILFTSRDELIAAFPDERERAEATGTGSAAIIPLVSRGHTYGAWSLSWPERREFAEGELVILLTLGAQGGQALERARLYERERFISTALQRTLLPQRLPELRGATTARRYRPSASGVEVGGDWYDVIRLPGGRVGLVIGDVGGHNIDAAAVMGQLRNAIRSYAWEGHPAGTVMEATNRLLCGLEPGVLATCCYVELNLEDGIASVALAGHPPPLIVDDHNAPAFMEMPADPPLGTYSNSKYEQASLFLSPWDSLVLYTDGLVETRALGLSQGMQRLAHVAGEVAGTDPEELADHLLRSAGRSDEREDDIALLVLRFEPVQATASPAGPRSVKRHLPSSAASAGVARRFAADVMTDWGAPDLVDPISLCVSELVTNALIHTATDVELVLRLSSGSVRVEVVDHSDRMPVKRSSTDDDTSGRGLHIVDTVATAWGVEPAGSGKAVWFEIERKPDASSAAS